jgi:hypothetical protein
VPLGRSADVASLEWREGEKLFDPNAVYDALKK